MLVQIKGHLIPCGTRCAIALRGQPGDRIFILLCVIPTCSLSCSLSYSEMDPIDTLNHSMLDVERVFAELRSFRFALDYLITSADVNRIYSDHLRQSYYLLQSDTTWIASFPSSCNAPAGDARPAILAGPLWLEVDLIVPLSPRFDFDPVQNDGDQWNRY